MGKILSICISIICITAALASCNNVGCLENQNSIPLAGFYDSSTGQSISLSNIEIGGVGAPHDSLLTSNGSISQVYLPFRSARNTTSFYIIYTDSELLDQGVRDTLTFDYKSEPYFASEDCGAMYRYTITEFAYTTNVVESVIVTDSLITNVDLERIKIYFRTASDETPQTSN